MQVCSFNRRRALSIMLSAFLIVGGQCVFSPGKAYARFHLFGSSEDRMPELKGFHLSPDGQSIQFDADNLQANGAGSITVLRYSAPSRLIVDIPNVQLSQKIKTNLYPKRNGIERIELSQINSDFYNAVRAVIYLQDPQALSKFNPSLDGNTLRLNPTFSSAPMTARTTSPNRSASVVQNKQRSKYQPPFVQPMASNASAMPLPVQGDALPVPSQANSAQASTGIMSIFGTPLPTDVSVVDKVAIKDDQIIIQTRNGGHLRIKNRSILTAPSRLVVDLDSTIVADRSLLGPVRGDSSDQIRSVRVGQFDERTVRLVIESPTPELFESVFNNQKRDSLTILPIAPAVPNRSSSTAIVNARPGEIENINLDHKNGGTLIKIEGSTPIQHRLSRKDNYLTLDLLNESGNTTNMGFDEKRFPELARMRLDSASTGSSRLTINLSSAGVRVVPTLSRNGKVLELLIVNDGTTGLAAVPTNVVSGASDNLSRLEQQVAVLPPAGDAPFAARIVVDAGHGGKDIGANRSGVYEKDLNLSLALMLRDALMAKGFKVYMTRSTDEFLPLPKITAITNQIHPDLFISIHHNASVNSAMHGIETYFYTPQSIPLAKRVHAREIAAVHEKDGGVKQARFYVIHHTDVPAILCEVGYVSNPTELTSLQTMERKSETAQSIADGVVDYLQTRMSASARPRTFGPAKR
jgi:N-acetylmuramoyl-L-alanine amidase